MLSTAQQKEFEAKGYFSVNVSTRGRFCILPSPMFNVLHVQTGDCYCAVPRAVVPLCDLMLSQKLILENDPERFFAVANCRREINPELVNEELRPKRVLLSRAESPRRQARWSELSMIPYEGKMS
jgi:hypothetical protein